MNETNVFLDILKSAITKTECDNLDGLDTDVWIRVYDISQKQQLSLPMVSGHSDASYQITSKIKYSFEPDYLPDRSYPSSRNSEIPDHFPKKTD